MNEVKQSAEQRWGRARRALAAASVAFAVTAVLSSAACSTSPPVPTPAAPPCTTLGPALDLGSLGLDEKPDRYVHTTAGWYRLRPDRFLHGGFFAPKVGQTEVTWGPASNHPVYQPGPAKVTAAWMLAQSPRARAAGFTCPNRRSGSSTATAST